MNGLQGEDRGQAYTGLLLDGAELHDRVEVFSQKQSYENFNSNANRHQSHMQLSQGGGGFARGTIFKSGKEWKMGGMAANANPQPGSASGYRQRKTIGHPGAAHSSSNAALKNPMGMTSNT